MDAERRPRHTDERIAALATRQAGVVSRRQLGELGVGRGAIEHRVRAGRLVPVAGHRGVFAVGHSSRGPRTALWAAFLALGPGAVASHRSAAALWALRPSPVRAELTVPSGGRRRSALIVHRTTWLPAADLARRDGLPVTSVARTLLDLGAVVGLRDVERAFDQADMLELLDMRAIDAVLAEGGGRPGAAKLRAVVGRDVAGSTLTDSELGEFLLAIVRRAGLPEPHQQFWVGGYRADFCWPGARLIVEADGARPHAARRRHAHDTRRDVELTNLGWTVLRFAYTHIVSEPAYVANAIRTALERAARVATAGELRAAAS
jgi:very-short-patch-repair endonuclease